MAKVLLGGPSCGLVQTTAHGAALADTVGALVGRGHGYAFDYDRGESLETARNQIMVRALAGDCDVLWWADSDIDWDAADAIGIIEHVLAHEEPFVSMPYVLFGGAWSVYDGARWLSELPAETVRAPGCGLGIACFHLPTFRAMWGHGPWFGDDLEFTAQLKDRVGVPALIANTVARHRPVEPTLLQPRSTDPGNRRPIDVPIIGDAQ